MYFTHENSNGTEFYIARATLDGSDHHILLNTSRQITSLTIDYDTRRLYFVYPRIRAIDYMDLTNGSVSRIEQTEMFSNNSPSIFLSIIFFFFG